MSGIPISLLPESKLQHVRLLQLPPELLELVTSDAPPRLQLKSQPNITGQGKDASAVLCTPDKTYNIRQVGTSNSVYLTQPIPAHDAQGGPSKFGIQTVAKCETTIELLSLSKKSAVPFIRAALPVYASTGSAKSTKAISKDELFSDIPLSLAECDDGWNELSCFEFSNPPRAYIPSAHVLASLWRATMQAALADNSSLTDPFPPGEIPAFAMDVCEDWPTEVITAAFASVSTSSPGGHRMVDQDKYVRSVGLSLLQSMSEGIAVETAGFVKAWKDTVPEAWRSKCDFAVLQGSYSLQDGGAGIKYSDNEAVVNGAAEGSTKDAKSLGAKRKWHEKFGASRKKA